MGRNVPNIGRGRRVARNDSQVELVSSAFWASENPMGRFFQNDKNPLENIGSEPNSPGKTRSRASGAALRAPVTTDPGGVAFGQAHASIEWPEWSCAGSRARKIKVLLFACWRVFSGVAICGRRRAGQSFLPLRWPEGGSIFLTFAVAGRLANLRPQC